MKASDRGLKHVCSACACKYYDLGNKGALCPKCGGTAEPDKLQASGRPVKKSRRTMFGQSSHSPAAPAAAAVAAEKSEDDAESEAEVEELAPEA